MKRRGSFDRSDYDFTSVLQGAAHFLMDEGAGDRPLSFKEIAQGVRHGRHKSEGDFLRAAYQVEGHDDKERGAEILTAEALKLLEKARLVEPTEDGWCWKGNGRTHFTAYGRKIPLFPKAEREEREERARLEAQFIMAEPQLPAREFDPETPENRALIASLRTVGFDDDFPILVDEEGVIVSGYNRAAACELVGIDWHDHTRTVRFTRSGPSRNIERTGKAVRANIGTGLSLATRKALQKKLRIEGHSTAEIAEAFGVSVRTVQNDLKSGSGATVASEPPGPEPSVTDDELVTLCMEEIRARPEMSKNLTLKRLSAAGHRFAKARGLKAYDVAHSRVATKAPEPAPPPPEPERVERVILRRYTQIVVDGEVVHEELVEEWIDET